MSATSTQSTHVTTGASFRNGVSLHRLLETAPLNALEPFLGAVEQGAVAASFLNPSWPQERDECAALQLRTRLIVTANGLTPELAAPLDRHAQRILVLSEGRGAEVVTEISELVRPPEALLDFQGQLDAVGRSTWLYQHRARLFDDAESLFYADHYRNFGRMYEAFELDPDAKATFVWDDTVKQALETKLQERLDLTGRCTITHLQVADKDRDGQLQHMIIVRHGGPLSSVAEFREDQGTRGEKYYRPLNEATLMYLPDEGILEVYSQSPGVRQEVARTFAETGLKIDLSKRPLTLKQYNFSRFLSSLELSTPHIPGFDIEQASVVEVDVRPDNPKHRAGLKVTIDDDITAVAESLFGKDNLFRRATSLAKVVIAVRYTQHGDNRRRTLNITLSEPNRCNLRSNRDPVQRDLGYALLSAWEILQRVDEPSADDEATLFPALLALYDQGKKEVPGRFFSIRGLDLPGLLAGGFIERKGRDNTIVLDEGEIQHTVAVRSAATPGRLVYRHPQDGRSVEIPASDVEKYAIRRDWLEEKLLRRIKVHLKRFDRMRLDEDLDYLGELQVGAEVVPCYLARDLRTHTTLQRLDVILRGRNHLGIGIVFSCGMDVPLCLGPNVVLPVVSYLAIGDPAGILDMPRVTSAYMQKKHLARGGVGVSLEQRDGHAATLYVPGKDPLNLAGAKQVAFFKALVDAYKARVPVVPTKTLMAAAGSNSKTPSQIFPSAFWKSIYGMYVGHPPGVQKGSFQLLD